MKRVSAFAGFVALATAQRPSNTSICDYYTTALLKTNNATTQETLLTLVVNTAVIGNYTQPNVGIAVPGILADGTMNGEKVSLLQYFTGALDSSNRGGAKGVAVNFLDSGAAAPLKMNKPANDMNSAQYKLLTHLYEYFAYLLGCSEYGNTVSPYSGFTGMYQVHKFMALDDAEVSYFIQQVGLSAASFGVAKEDVEAVGKALNDAFGYRCSPAASIPASASAQLQSICTEDDCPLAPNSTCSSYQPVIEPTFANGTATNGTSSAGSPSGGTNGTSSSGSGSSSESGSASATPSGPTSTASVVPSTGGAADLAPAGSLALAIFMAGLAYVV